MDAPSRDLLVETGWNLADGFEAVAALAGDREAAVAGSARRTYRELDDRASRWAALFAARGVGPGDRVALVLRNGIGYLEAMLGAFKARAVPVNVNHHYVAEELRHLLGDAEPAVVVVAADLAPTVEAVTPGGGDRVLVVDEHLDATLDAVPPAPARTDRRDDDLYLLYTGGTTGLPKGVEWRHRDLVVAALGGVPSEADAPTATVRRRIPAADRATRVLVASPLMHGTAQWVALATLLSGGTVVLTEQAAFDPERLWDVAAAEAVGQLVVVGDAFAVPLVAALDAEPDRWDLDALVVVASGGATLSAATAGALLRLLPGAVVVDGYGTTETGGQARRVLVPGLPGTGSGPARFVPDVDTALIALDLGTVLAPGSGAVGWIARRGNLPLGYRNDPDRTAATFPTVAGERWALTGDLGRAEPDGTIALVGRGGRTINTGGEKVDPGEVEAVLRDHPAVGDAMVVGVADHRFGEQVAALVRTVPGRSVALDDLIRHCRVHLARFKVPRRLVVIAELPRSPAGKPDYRRAAELLTAPPDVADAVEDADAAG